MGGDSLTFPKWLANYFSRLTTEQSMSCMQEMLHVNIRQNGLLASVTGNLPIDELVHEVEQHTSFKPFVVINICYLFYGFNLYNI
jgi:clathrin heavy chain